MARERLGRRVAITGASGLVGRALCAALRAQGVEVVAMVRRRAVGDGEISWDPGSLTVDAARLEGLDAFVHLAGESVASRFTEAHKSRIRDSRVLGTRTIARGLCSLTKKPRVVVGASAIGYYGDRGEETLVEESSPGEGFFPGVVRAWEDEYAPLGEAGIRTVRARFGIVLAKEGGALKEMLLPFKLGVGGRLGKGDQWMSWVLLEDVVEILLTMLSDERLSGPVNVVAPHPVRNADFTRALGRALGRPTLLPVPRFGLRLALGAEMADNLLFGSARVMPRKLESIGQPFIASTIDEAFARALG